MGLYTYIKNINNYHKYLVEYEFFKKLTLKNRSDFQMNWINRFPALSDKSEKTPFDRHYIYHPVWAAQIITRYKPKVHIDISSTLHFSTMLSPFIKTEFYDYRPADIKLTNLKVGHADLTNLHFASNSISSLSCMHTIEHIGLGRYGDPISANGDLSAINELIRVLSPHGNLLIVVPIGGNPKILFNAHRIYSYSQFISYFSKLKLIEFSLIQNNPTDGAGIIKNASKSLTDKEKYGCGCFWFKK